MASYHLLQNNGKETFSNSECKVCFSVYKKTPTFVLTEYFHQKDNQPFFQQHHPRVLLYTSTVVDLTQCSWWFSYSTVGSWGNSNRGQPSSCWHSWYSSGHFLAKQNGLSWIWSCTPKQIQTSKNGKIRTVVESSRLWCNRHRTSPNSNIGLVAF